MSGGPVVQGVNYNYEVLVGGEFQLFAETAITDASSSSLTLTVSLSQAASGSLVDLNAGADGGSYDSATGVYTVSGTPAQVTTALRGLQFVPAAGSQGVYETLTLNVTDGLANSTLSNTLAEIYAAQSYAGGGQTLTAIAQNSGFLLSNTGGVADTIAAANPGDYAIAVLNDAQASFALPTIVWLAGRGDSATFSGNSDLWDAAYGDSGTYMLDGVSLAVFGDDAFVTFQGAGDRVSFNAPANKIYHETVDGSGGTIVAVHSDVALTGDNDVIYFDNSGDTLDLYGVTAGAWSVLYASSGAVNLHGASLSIFGGGVTVNGVSNANAVSLYKSDGVADTVTGDDMTITLVNSQAVVNGTRDAIWFVGGSASTLALNLTLGQYDSVYGAGTINLNGDGSVISVGGGALVNLATGGADVYVSYTSGVWDHVQGAAGNIIADHAQVVVDGGHQSVTFAGGDDNAASFIQTNGAWDSVYGAVKTLTIDDAQVNIYGSADDIYMTGPDAQVSFYAPPYYSANSDDNLYATNATIDENGQRNLTISGGYNKIFANSSGNSSVILTQTQGEWDSFFGSNQSLVLNGAQVSMIGGGNSVLSEGANNAVSLYQTNGNDDTIENFGASITTVTLNDSSAILYGGMYYVYMNGGVNNVNLDVIYYNNSKEAAFVLTGAVGDDTITGFGSQDVIEVSHSQFADFQAFQSALSQQSGGAALTLDANDKVTFVGEQTANITAAQVKFV